MSPWVGIGTDESTGKTAAEHDASTEAKGMKELPKQPCLPFRVVWFQKGWIQFLMLVLGFLISFTLHLYCLGLDIWQSDYSMKAYEILLDAWLNLLELGTWLPSLASCRAGEGYDDMPYDAIMS